MDNPDFINTENASGELWTSQPLHTHGVLLPKSIVIENGRMTGEIDFVRVFGTFLFNLLQEQLPASSSNDMRAMILNLHVNKAKLDLRVDSVFAKDNKTFHIGEQSQVSLLDLVVDKDFNYTGDCQIDVNFLPGSKWVGKKVDCDFDSGNAHLFLKASRQNDILTFTPVDQNREKILLERALLKFGKNKRSSVFCRECFIDIKDLTWQRQAGESDAALHVLANLKLMQTDLNVKTDRHQTTAYFPEAVPARIQIDIDKGVRQTQFETLGAALAQKASIEIFRPSSKVSLHLEQARIGPISFDKSGNFNLSFARGKANLKELRWSNGKKYLCLKSAGFSQLSLPQGMYMLLDKISGVRMSLPLAIKMGSATMESATGKLAFSAIDGKMLIDVDNEIVLQGDINFVLEESSFLGSHQVAVKVKGLNLSPKKSFALAHLQKCTLVIPNKDLLDVIQNQFPKEKCLNIDKTIFEKRHWRYRNAEIKTVTLCDMTLNKLTVEGVNSAKLVLSADVTVDGSIEKNSVLSIVKEYKKYKSKDWQIKAKCVGVGEVNFKFISNGALSKSTLPYTLHVELPIPDDVQLDWSKVESGIYKGLEHGIIMSILKKMDKIPLTYEGEQPLFNKSHTQLDLIKLSNMTTKGIPEGVQVDFVADATF